MSKLIVRAIEGGDRDLWAPLWSAYLAFYETPERAEVTAATWSRLFDPLEPVHGIVAARGETLIGFSHYLFQRSTWLVAPRCYLQDLFVSPAERGGGTGKALIGAVAEAARAAGAQNVYWNTHESNATARRLYDAVATRTGFLQYRIDL